MECRHRRVLAVSLLLFIGILGANSTQPYNPESDSWSEIAEEHNASFALSEENPNYTYNITQRYMISAQLALVIINETPISVSVSSELETILVLRIVTCLRNLPINFTTPVPGHVSITFSRINDSASVRAKILEQHLRPPPTGASLTWNPLPMILFMVFSLSFGYYLARAEIDCWGPLTSREGISLKAKHAGPLAVALLVAVSALLVGPLVNGILHDQYSPIEVERTLNERTFALSLNESSPVSSINLTEIAHSYEETIRKFRLHSLEFENGSVLMEAIVGGEHEKVIVDGNSNPDHWWVQAILDGNGYHLTFRRIDTDLCISLSLDIIAKEVALKNDPIPPAILALCGGGLIALCLHRSWNIKNRIEEGMKLYGT